MDALLCSRLGTLCLSRRGSRSEPFAEPVPLPPAIQDQAGEMASLSGDGLTLAFASKPSADEDIWLATRPSRDAEFGPPTRLPAPVNSPEHERVPVLSTDGLTLFVTTIRRSTGNGQVRQYTRASREAPCTCGMQRSE